MKIFSLRSPAALLAYAQLRKKPITFCLRALIVVCGAVVLTGCKPNQISGQVFVVTQSGLNMPLGAVEIDLIDSAETEDYLKNRNAEIKNESDAISAQIKEAAQQYEESGRSMDDAHNKYLAAVQAEQDFERNQPFTTNKTYILLTKQYQEYAAQLQAVDYPPNGGVRISQNAPPPDLNLRPKLARAMLDVQSQLRTLQDNLTSPIKESRYQAEQTFNQLSSARAEIQTKLNQLRAKLNAVKTPRSLFSHFSPHPIEKVVTDAEGKFVINVTKKQLKLYARAERQVMDEVENFYWLLEIPSDRRVIILSNNNAFSVAADANSSN
jgi:hypothetical protein